jgi:ABC-2 type transport system permease protein
MSAGASHLTTARAAPAARRIAAQSRFETLTMLRNGEQLLVAVVLPALVLAGLVATSFVPLGEGRRVDLVVPGVLALCVISSGFTGVAIATGFDRRYGVLRLLGASPLGRLGLLAAKAVSVLAVVALQFAVIGALGLALGWDPRWSGAPAAALTTLLGVWAFVALALLLAGTVRAEGVLALANLVWVLLLALGGVVVPTRRLPEGLATVVELLPSAALGDGLRSALVLGQPRVGAWVVLVVWAAVATTLASRLFRWSD